MASNFYLVAEQQRNAPLVKAVNDFLDHRDDAALMAVFGPLSTGEQVMLIGYLVAADCGAMARALLATSPLSLVTALQTLDRANGSELARQLQWTERPPTIHG